MGLNRAPGPPARSRRPRGYFEARGYHLRGARAASSGPDWKYVNLRRYVIYLERCIERGTQWAVFEPNLETCG